MLLYIIINYNLLYKIYKTNVSELLGEAQQHLDIICQYINNKYYLK